MSLAANQADLEGALTRFRDRPLQHFVNGAAFAGDSGETFANSTPIDDTVIADRGYPQYML